ncbi:MAG: putative phenazine biosynthesis protein PhzF family protein [Frankiales bacterium]|nr:putative phenazine biosynthesis protein PhzF family protein [Frankiales bacterium]
MDIPLIWIDAFAERLFEGNPAAVMPLAEWLPDRTLQALAAENNLSETAFYCSVLPAAAAPEAAAQSAAGSAGTQDAVAAGPTYHLRWFTPSIEVDLCGHATLATAAHLLDDVHPKDSHVRFWTRSGWLRVTRSGPRQLTMDFPSEPLLPVAPDPVVAAALGVTPTECRRATDLIYVVAAAEKIAALRPDFAVLAGLDARGVIVTAPGEAGSGFDFVSRWFGAGAGIGEDPVTGSAHSQIAPYWAERLGKSKLTARQLSARGGTVRCEVVGDRVLITGSYRRYLDATVHLD